MTTPITTSANLLRRSLCPGSARMELSTPPSAASPDAEDAPESAALHGHFTDRTILRTALSDADLALLEAADDLCAAVLLEASDPAAQNSALPSAAESFTQGYARTLHVRAHAGSIATRQFPGTIDFWRCYPERRVAVVIAARFARIALPPEEQRLQLAAQALMAFDELDHPQRILSAIVQPRQPFPRRLAIAEYEPRRIADARAEILAIHGAALRLGAPLAASEAACRGCRARLACPAFRERIFALHHLDPRPLVERLDTATLARFVESVKLARLPTFTAPILAEAALRIETGEMPSAADPTHAPPPSAPHLAPSHVAAAGRPWTHPTHPRPGARGPTPRSRGREPVAPPHVAAAGRPWTNRSHQLKISSHRPMPAFHTTIEIPIEVEYDTLAESRPTLDRYGAPLDLHHPAEIELLAITVLFAPLQISPPNPRAQSASVFPSLHLHLLEKSERCRLENEATADALALAESTRLEAAFSRQER